MDTILKTGCKAYLDSFNGLIPAVVVSVTDMWNVKLRLTASRAAYKRGEVIETNSLHAVPREAVHVRSGQYRIGFYRTQVDETR
jgi:hypothetical protein